LTQSKNPFKDTDSKEKNVRRTLVATPSKFAIIVKTPKAPNKRSSRNEKRTLPALSPQKSRHLSTIFKNEVQQESKTLANKTIKTATIATKLKKQVKKEPNNYKVDEKSKTIKKETAK